MELVHVVEQGELVDEGAVPRSTPATNLPSLRVLHQLQPRHSTTLRNPADGVVDIDIHAGDYRSDSCRGGESAFVVARNAYAWPVVNAQVLLDGRGAGLDDVLLSAARLRRSSRPVEVVNTPKPTWKALRGAFGASVVPTAGLRRDVPLVVVSGRVALASGAVRRLVAHSDVRGRCVTRVLVPGLNEAQQVTCWSTAWLKSYGGDVADLLDADLAFDREHLPPGSPTARSWVLADQIGVSVVEDIGGRTAMWARSTGMRLDLGRLWGTSVRGPAGSVKRRLARKRQRRRDQRSRG